MRVRLKLFAILRDRAGSAETELNLPEGSTVSAAMAEVARQFPQIAQLLARAAVAINLEYSNLEAVLHDGDELAVIPPVSGGRDE